MKNVHCWAMAGMALLTLLPAPESAAADRERTIVFNEDRAQHLMTTKVYPLANVKAHDLAPYILGAIKRFDDQSTIQSLDYTQDGKQYLVVSTGSQLLPYIDQMIAELDYPSQKIDENGSAIDGDGIYRFVYGSHYRGSDNMREVVEQTFTGGFGSGAAYFDEPTNMFYWKSSKSQGEEYLKLLETLDRPVPQMQLSLHIYCMTDNNFRELGVDYLGWKNGPGAQLLGAAYSFSSFDSVQHLADAFDLVSSGPLADATGLGGLMVAPNFDATFLRMLAQKGKASIASEAALTLINDYTSPAAGDWDSATYRFRFTPQFQLIVKDDDQDTSITAPEISELSFYVDRPIVSIGEDGKATVLMCTYDLTVDNLVETTDEGLTVTDENHFSSWLTLAGGTEKLIAAFEKEVDTTQYNGMPFLGDIPVLRYLVGAESSVKSKLRIFVTLTATPVVTANPAPEIAKL